MYHQLLFILVLSIHNVCKDQMYYYNWTISGEMFRPLAGHSQANKEYYYYGTVKLFVQWDPIDYIKTGNVSS